MSDRLASQVGIRLTLPKLYYQVDDDLNITRLQSLDGIVKEARRMNPEEEPLVVMSAEFWNKMQDIIDELGIREELQAKARPNRPFCLVIKKSNMFRLPDVAIE